MAQRMDRFALLEPPPRRDGLEVPVHLRPLPGQIGDQIGPEQRVDAVGPGSRALDQRRLQPHPVEHPAGIRPADSSAPRAAGEGKQTLTTRRKLCVSALNPSRISTVRYSATERSSPEKSVRKAAGSSLRRRASAASRSPAAQPSVRACSTATSAGVSCRPAARSREVVSSTVKAQAVGP